MYYYAKCEFWRLNLRRGCYFFFFFFSKKEWSHMWSSLLLYFVPWIVTMHLCKSKGERAERGRTLCILVLRFLGSWGKWPSLPGRVEWERGSQALRSAQWGIQGPVSLAQAFLGLGVGGAILPTSVAQDLHPRCAVLVSLVQHEAPEGPSTLPHCLSGEKFSPLAEFRTLASSGKPCLTQRTFNLYVTRNHLLALF